MRTAGRRRDHEPDLLDAVVSGKGAHGLLDALQVRAADFEKLNGRGHVDVEDAGVPFSGPGDFRHVGGHQLRPGKGQLVEPGAGRDVEPLERLLDDQGERLGVAARFRRIGVDRGEAGNEGNDTDSAH